MVLRVLRELDCYLTEPMLAMLSKSSSELPCCIGCASSRRALSSSALREDGGVEVSGTRRKNPKLHLPFLILLEGLALPIQQVHDLE